MNPPPRALVGPRSRVAGLALGRPASALTLLLLVPGLDGCNPGAEEAVAVAKDRAPAVLPAPPSTSAVVPLPSATAVMPLPSATPTKAGPTESKVPRVYAKTRNVWVFPRPDSSGQWIGFLWYGTSVALRETEPVAGPGCKAWYAIEPRGYVCVEGERATLDPDDEFLKSARAYAPDLDSATPHRYGESIGLRRYATLPTEKQQRAYEWDYAERMDAISRARNGEKVSLLDGIDVTRATAPPPTWHGLPRTLQMEREQLLPRSTVAWSHEVEHLGRTWLLTADLKWVPKDRVKPYPDIEFSGVHLDKEETLPLAFFRGKARPKFTRNVEGRFEETGETFPRLSHVGLTGKLEESEGTKYLETREAGIFVREADAVVPPLAKQTPWGAPLSEPDAELAPTTKETESSKPTRPSGRRTWLEVSVLGGWLVAYEGTTPVFTTLISPGRGGPHRGEGDPVETASTPLGRYKITGKFATSTMVAPGDFVHSDVPWAQNFSGPHAIHGAYWHDAWGELKSGGCINLSPVDGKWLYGFTEPSVPDGWFGVRWLPDEEGATTLIVHR